MLKILFYFYEMEKHDLCYGQGSQDQGQGQSLPTKQQKNKITQDNIQSFNFSCSIS